MHTEVLTADGNTCRVSVGNIFKAENLKASLAVAAHPAHACSCLLGVCRNCLQRSSCGNDADQDVPYQGFVRTGSAKQPPKQAASLMIPWLTLLLPGWCAAVHRRRQAVCSCRCQTHQRAGRCCHWTSRCGVNLNSLSGRRVHACMLGSFQEEHHMCNQHSLLATATHVTCWACVQLLCRQPWRRVVLVHPPTKRSRASSCARPSLCAEHSAATCASGCRCACTAAHSTLCGGHAAGFATKIDRSAAVSTVETPATPLAAQIPSSIKLPMAGGQTTLACACTASQGRSPCLGDPTYPLTLTTMHPADPAA